MNIKMQYEQSALLIYWVFSALSLSLFSVLVSMTMSDIHKIYQ